MQQVVCLRHESTIIFRRKVKIDIAREQALLIANHRRTAAEVHLGDL